jgi:hypothetical protein
MENAHQLESWRDLYVMLGTSAAALIGLLFVATSLHLDDIAGDPILRTRSRNVTLHLVAMLVQAMAVLTPQPLPALGIEIVIINLCGLYLPLTFTYKAFIRGRDSGKRGGFSIYVGMTYMLGYGLGLVGGVALGRSLSWGLYPVTLANAVFFVSVIWNAWKLMVGIRKPENAAKNIEARL